MKIILSITWSITKKIILPIFQKTKLIWISTSPKEVEEISMDKWKNDFTAKLHETTNFVMIVRPQKRIVTFPRADQLRKADNNVKTLPGQHKRMKEAALTISETGYKENCSEFSGRFRAEEQTRDSLLKTKNVSIALDSLVVFSAISTGDGRVTLNVVGDWTKAKGLQLLEKITSPPITNFQGRKLILSAVHVRKIIILITNCENKSMNNLLSSVIIYLLLVLIMSSVHCRIAILSYIIFHFENFLFNTKRL